MMPHGQYALGDIDGVSQSLGKAERLTPGRPAWKEAIGNAVEGGVDAVMGVIGIGPETTTNRVGQLLSAGLPFAGAMKGAKAIGAIKRREALARHTPSLDMSQSARMARAKDMGFRDTPLYHGTAMDVPAFDLAQGGRTSGSRVGSLGVAATRQPEIAAEFADLSARGGSGQNILPLMHRTQRPGVIDLTGQETNAEMAATLADAWESGFDAVLLRNYTSPGGVTGQTIIVKDPAQLRSRFAAFDPAKKGSRDLLASGVLATGAAATGRFALSEIDRD